MNGKLLMIALILVLGLAANAMTALENGRDSHATVSPMGTQLPAHDLWVNGVGPSTPNSYGVAGNPNRVGVQAMPPLGTQTVPDYAAQPADEAQKPKQVDVYEYPTYTQ